MKRILICIISLLILLICAGCGSISINISLGVNQPEPTATPTARPTTRPTTRPTARPTLRPTAKPTARPDAKASTSVSNASSGGKAMATKEEAEEIAREFLGIKKTDKYTCDVELMGDYYRVYFKVDYGEESNEVACKVDARGFYAYDPAG